MKDDLEMEAKTTRIPDKQNMKENKPMTEGSNLSQQKLTAKQHYLSIARYVVGRSTNIGKT